MGGFQIFQRIKINSRSKIILGEFEYIKENKFFIFCEKFLNWRLLARKIINCVLGYFLPSVLALKWAHTWSEWTEILTYYFIPAPIYNGSYISVKTYVSFFASFFLTIRLVDRILSVGNLNGNFKRPRARLGRKNFLSLNIQWVMRNRTVCKFLRKGEGSGWASKWLWP